MNPLVPRSVLTEDEERDFRAAAELHMRGELAGAAVVYERLLAGAPEEYRLNHLLGGLRCQQSRSREALECLERARRLRPFSAPTLVCLGMTLSGLGRIEEAEKTLRLALAIVPTSEEAWANLGAVQIKTGRLDDAIASMGRAVELKPGYAHGWTALGTALHIAGRMAEAVAAHTRALELNPAEPRARFGRGQALQGCHDVAAARADFEAQLALKPDHLPTMSARLFLLNFDEGMSREDLAAEHAAFGRAAAAAAPVRSPDEAPSVPPHPADGRLRVAILSPDLRGHAVACFLEPLLIHLDRSRIELTLYHDHFSQDGKSSRLRRLADHWRQVVGMDHDGLERLIRADAPEILIDLAGHTGFNRMELFARRVAPVQVTYLGYPNTTGLKTMDFRLTDPVADPVGETDALHTEELVRFAPTAWAYAAPAEAPPPGRRGGAEAPVTFGSFNSLSKVGPATLRLWREVLEARPGSRLVLKSTGLVSDRWPARLRLAGIDPARVELRSAAPTTAEHLAAYGDIDVALDPFPYNGTTTTCDALWMGVPVVTLAGDRHPSRVGVSLLTAVGRTEWIARTPAEYVRIAAALAADPAGRGVRREELRAAMLRSALLDHAGQARRFADALWFCRERSGLGAGKIFPATREAEPSGAFVVPVG